MGFSLMLSRRKSLSLMPCQQSDFSQNCYGTTVKFKEFERLSLLGWDFKVAAVFSDCCYSLFN